MATVAPFSVNTGGAWSPRQARAVLEAVREEARARGVDFKPIQITTMGGPERVLLLAFCIRHQEPLEIDSACGRCLKEPR